MTSSTSERSIAERLNALQEDARPREALATLEGEEPERWTDPAAVIEGWRLLSRLGAPKRASKLLFKRYRRDPTHPLLLYGVTAERFQRRGPYAAWRALRTIADPADGPTAFRTLYLRSSVAIALRDFPAAERAVARMTALGAPAARVAEARADLLRAQDKREEGLAVAREALVSQPRSIWLVDTIVELYDELGRSRESLDLLREKEAALDAAPLSLRLAHVLLEQGDTTGSDRALERALERFALAEPELVRNMAAVRAEVAYRSGRIADAIALARKSEVPTSLRLAERLERLPDAGARRHVLDVPHVSQHRSTCVPATLTALLSFEGISARQEEIADAICFDGTAAHAERSWAEERGLVMREFTLTLDVAVRILDAGVAMSLVFVDAMQAHMVAVVGYDLRRDSLVVMDPAHTGASELHAPTMFELMLPYGPRAAVVLPRASADRLAKIELPEAALYDQLHEVHRALDRGDDELAQRHHEALERAAPSHRLAVWAARALALHAGDLAEAAALSKRLLERFERDLRSRTLLAQCILSDRTRTGRVDEVTKLCEGARGALPHLWSMLAVELARDGRSSGQASALARRSLRVMGADAPAMTALARCALHEGRREEALETYEVASALDFANEGVARAFFDLSRRGGRALQALSILRERADRWRARSAHPSITLCGALELLGRHGEWRAELDRLIAVRPRDPEALVFACEQYAAVGCDRRAAACLRALKERAVGPRVATSTAAILVRAGHVDVALEALEAARRARPRDLDVVQRMIHLIGELRGPAARMAFARELVASREDPAVIEHGFTVFLAPEERVAIAKRALDKDPLSLAAVHEWGAAALAADDRKEARAAAARAKDIAPKDPGTYALGARVAHATKKLDVAVRRLRSAIELDVDQPRAIELYVDLATNAAERSARVAEILGAAIDRSASGSAVTAWAACARGFASARAVRAGVARLRRERPDLALVWALSIEVESEDGCRRRAAALAEQAVELHPDDLQVATAAAHALRGAGDLARALAVVRRVAARSPSPQAVLSLVSLLRAAGRTEAARRRALAGLRRFPHAPGLLHAAATMDAEAGDVDTAVRRLDRALEIAPRIRALWAERINVRAGKDGAEVLARAEQWANGVPWDPEPSTIAAWLARQLGRGDVALGLARRVYNLAPNDVSVREALAWSYLRGNQPDDALRACRHDDLQPFARSLLRVRKAVVLAALERMNDARREISAVLEVWPDHGPALELALALEEHGQSHARPTLEAIEAAGSRLLRVMPDSERALLAVAGASHSLGRPAKGRRLYRRLLREAPSHPEALAGGADAAIALRRFVEALERIDRLAAIDPGRARAKRVELELARSETAAALAVFDDLAKAEEPDPDALLGCIEAWSKTAYMEDLTKHLDELCVAESSPRWFTRWWGETRPKFASKHTVSKFMRFALSVSEERGAVAVAATLEAFAGRPDAPLWRWVARYALVARRRTALWAAVGYCLLNRGWLWASLVWTRGWARREEVRAWMLLNVALAWAGLGFLDRAARVHRAALDLPHDHTTDCHRTLAALHCAWNRDSERATELLRSVSAGTEKTARIARPIVDLLLQWMPSVAAKQAPYTPAFQSLSEWQRTLAERGELYWWTVHALDRTRRAFKRLPKRHRPQLERVLELFPLMVAGSGRRVALFVLAAVTVIAVGAAQAVQRGSRP